MIKEGAAVTTEKPKSRAQEASRQCAHGQRYRMPLGKYVVLLSVTQASLRTEQFYNQHEF